MQNSNHKDSSSNLKFWNWASAVIIFLSFVGFCFYRLSYNQDFQEVRRQKQHLIAQNIKPINCQLAFNQTEEAQRVETFKLDLERAINCLKANDTKGAIKADVSLDNLSAHQRYLTTLSPHNLVEPKLKELVTEEFEIYQRVFVLAEEPLWLFKLKFFSLEVLKNLGYLLLLGYLILLIYQLILYGRYL